MTRTFLLWILAALLVGGCAPAALPAEVPATEDLLAELLPQPTAPLAADSAEPASPELPSATPKVRTGLDATDPTTVAVGAGKPVLLEFFAFW